MKIVKLQAENVKRLVAVEISPAGNVVEITGKNGQGKTSVLDAIWWALAGAGTVQKEPIRKGQQQAKIRLDLGEIVVTRNFKRGEDGEVSTSVTVEGDGGARFPSPQRMLDSLLGALSFDPLEFARMDPKAQFDALRRFVPGVDFEAIERDNDGDYARRTDVNRQAKDCRTLAERMQVKAGLAPVDVAAIASEISAANHHNAETARQEEQYAQRRRQADSLKREAATDRHRANALRSQAADLEHEAARKEQAAGNLRDEAGKLEIAAPIDVATLTDRLSKAEEINAQVRQSKERDTYLARAEGLEAESAALTKLMAHREAAKRAAIAAAKMPVPGIEFGDKVVLLNGVPFEQASDAEKLRTEWATGRMLTDTGAREADRRQGMGDRYRGLIAEAEREERGGA